ncbi:pentatricopeptide repeat-containing protein At1g02150 [Dendrobium catenatum]|uniref:Pentatricopeptide repeat-containing protein n=1 Tax=Dendrobium catenatum TaxID=906689 RepID=A0A2I0WCB8_9ASPA|nr:pentatricopeptide repeat-containing protein At1g02150 [Dendrobium catenatum]PKU73305.1 Pentatricopeptide repeat-containing protein [Dendrobium catenatum]
MRLHAAISPTPSPPHLICLSARGSSSCSGIPLGLRLGAPHLIAGRRRSSELVAIRCSISQVHSYGTVDYEQRPPLKWSSLYRRISITENPNVDSATVLEQWEGAERKLSKWDLCRVVKELRRFGRFKRALEVYDWMASHGDRFILNSSDNAIQLDLIAKVRGISHAEGYFSILPCIFKDRRTYGALLNAYGKAKMRDKAEATLETMKGKGYTDDALPFNVMMTLYMNIAEHRKVYAIINEMKAKNVSFDLYSYNILITNCATMGDVEEMERVVQEMIVDARVNANWTTYTTLATMYIRLGEFDKAENCLKEVELRMTGRDRASFNYLLGLYSSIAKRDEVYRVWKRYKSAFGGGILNSGYQSMLSSLVKLGDIEGTEKIYEEWLSSTSRLDPRICNVVMRSYVRKGGVGNAKRILDRFVEKGGVPKPLSWEILAEGYLKEKMVSEVLWCMEGAAAYKGLGKWKPKQAAVAETFALCREEDSEESVKLLMDVLRRTGCLEKEAYKLLVET